MPEHRLARTRTAYPFPLSTYAVTITGDAQDPLRPLIEQELEKEDRMENYLPWPTYTWRTPSIVVVTGEATDPREVRLDDFTSEQTRAMENFIVRSGIPPRSIID